jgi:hypothetical protein
MSSRLWHIGPTSFISTVAAMLACRQPAGVVDTKGAWRRFSTSILLAVRPKRRAKSLIFHALKAPKRPVDNFVDKGLA